MFGNFKSLIEDCISLPSLCNKLGDSATENRHTCYLNNFCCAVLGHSFLSDTLQPYRTVACQALPPLEFFRQEFWGWNQHILPLLHWQVDSLRLRPRQKYRSSISGLSSRSCLKSRCWSGLQFCPEFRSPLPSSLAVGRIHFLVAVGLSCCFYFS